MIQEEPGVLKKILEASKQPCKRLEISGNFYLLLSMGPHIINFGFNHWSRKNRGKNSILLTKV